MGNSGRQGIIEKLKGGRRRINLVRGDVKKNLHGGDTK